MAKRLNSCMVYTVLLCLFQKYMLAVLLLVLLKLFKQVLLVLKGKFTFIPLIVKVFKSY